MQFVSTNPFAHCSVKTPADNEVKTIQGSSGHKVHTDAYALPAFQWGDPSPLHGESLSHV